MSYTNFVKQLRFSQTELLATYKEALTKNHRLKVKRPIRLRASGLPICSLTVLEQMLLDEYDLDEAMMDYYCSVGTTVHTHLQKWLGKSGKIFGNWKCLSCGHQHQHSLKYKCSKCKSHMQYEELEIEYNIFSGHIDGVFKQSNGRFIVYDYKTTSSRNIFDKRYIPVAKHIVQLTAYAALLVKQHDLDIESVSIIYVARDNPTQVAECNIKFTPELYQHTMSFLKGQIRGFKAALKSRETGELRYAIKYKLCESFNEYKEEHEKFIGMHGCPLAKVCFNQQRLAQHFSDLF